MPTALPGKSASEVLLPALALSTDFCPSQGVCRDFGGLQSIIPSGREWAVMVSKWEVFAGLRQA